MDVEFILKATLYRVKMDYLSFGQDAGGQSITAESRTAPVASDINIFDIDENSPFFCDTGLACG